MTTEATENLGNQTTFNSVTTTQATNKDNHQHIQKPILVMHIIDKLSVSGSGIHGVTRAIERWLPRFDPQHFQFCICSLRSPEEIGKIFEEKGIPIFFLDKGKFDPTTLTSLLTLIKQEEPDILHLHGYGATNFGRLASKLTGVPNIVHEHVVVQNQPFYQTVADTILSSLTTKAIAISPPVREFMVNQRKIRPEILETFFYGIPLAEFQLPNQSEVDRERESLGIAADEQVVFYVGRLDEQKGLIYLLKAAILILKELPKTRFLIVGDGPDMPMLKSFSEKEKISDRLIFTGFRENIPVLLGLADVVAIPSLHEGGPITLFEAMNLHKPVVGTPVGLMGEAILEGETGHIVPCKNVDMLAKRLIHILLNPQLAHSMGEKAWEVCQNYDISNSVQRLGEIYQDLEDLVN
ncbi:glycosyltransferase family 4 protein [Dapis sp. BLCC M126]|uniref:glycosyltransferase family 4 protein n=1 Tax=Dapis sp. BLCC M126 TaxID=3400189 RepID=UPI003CFA74EA